MLQILLYDKKEMHIFDVVGYYPQPVGVMEFDVTMLEDMHEKKMIIPNCTYQAEIETGEIKAELDPTTMKRIAKYNLDKDLEELNRQIKSAEERLKNLNERAEENERKLELMRELFPKIWHDSEFDKDKYFPDEDDYEEDEWE